MNLNSLVLKMKPFNKNVLLQFGKNMALPDIYECDLMLYICSFPVGSGASDMGECEWVENLGTYCTMRRERVICNLCNQQYFKTSVHIIRGHLSKRY